MSSPKPKRRRWRRRLALAALSFLALLLGLVLAGPSLALNGFVENKVAEVAGGQIGRPVVVEGVRFGWMTPFRIDRIELPPIEGEAERPAFALKEVRSTFSLGKILRGLPLQFGELEVGSIEGNLIRLPDGRWNVNAILEELAPEEPVEEEPEEEEPEKEPSAEAPSFPLDFSRIEIKSMNFRVVDAEQDLIAGYEDGHFALTWHGGMEPLAIRAGGNFRAGERMMPWDAGVDVTEWIDGERRLRLDAIRVEVRGGAGDAGGDAAASDDSSTTDSLMRRGAGEFRLLASLEEGSEGSFAGRLPFEPWMNWAKGLPQATEAPEVDGELKGDATFVHRNKFQQVEAEAAMQAAASARLILDGEEKTLPEQRFDFEFGSSIDLEKQRVERLELKMTSAPATASLKGRGIALDDFGASEALDAEFNADLGEAGLLGAQFMHGEAIRPLEAVLAGKATLIPSAEGKKRLAFEADFSPGELTTLSPFAENPPWLDEGPLDLSPLGFTWTGEVEAGPDNEKFDVNVRGTRGEILKLGETRAQYAQPDAAWSADTGLSVDLATAFDRIVKRIAGDALDDLGATLELQASAQGRGEEAITSRGQVALAGLRLQLPDNEYAFEEASTTIDWDVAFDPKETQVTLSKVEVVNSFLSMNATGQASPKTIKNISAKGEFSLNALSDRLVEFLQLETPPAGLLEFEALAQGDIGKKIDASFRMETPEPLEYAQPELVMLSLPVGIDADATVTYEDEKPERVDWALVRFEVGEIVTASGKGRLGLGERPDVEAELTADVLFTPVTEMIDPAFWEQQDLAAVIEGGTRLEMRVGGTLPVTDGEGNTTADLRIEGLLETGIEYLEAMQGEMTAAAEGFTDRREFTVTVKGMEPGEMLYRDTAVTELALAQTSQGAAIGGLSIRTAVEAPGEGTVRLTLEDLTLEETQYADEMVEALLPPLHMSGRFAVDPATTEAEVSDFSMEMEELVSMTMNATYGGEEETWAAQVQSKLGPLDALMDYVVFKGEDAPAIADLTGEAEMDMDFRGTVPGEDFDPLGGVPAEGELTARWSGIGLSQGETARVEGAGGQAVLRVLPGGNDFGGEMEATVERVELAALEAKTLEPIRMKASFGMQGMDRAQFELEEMSVASLGFATNARGEVAGLRRVLEAEEAMQPADYLHALDVDAEFSVDQTLAELSGITEGMTAGGTARVNGSFRNEAERVLSFVSTMEFEGVEAHLEELLDIEGLSGSWTAGKTLPLRGGLATPKSPAPGQIRADLIHAAADPFDVEMLGNAFIFQGFQSGFTMRMESENLIGGPATMQGGLAMVEGDPTLNGRVQLTGLDLGRLAKQLRDLQGPEAEINGVAEFEWRIPESAEGGILNGITMRAASSRIGKRAFKRMLEALDPEGEDPRIQKAITALNLGRPSGVNVELQDSLLTFGAELETLGGVKVPLPIIERQSLGDVEQVYELDEYTPMVGLARTALNLMLAQDFETFERHLNALETTP